MKEKVVRIIMATLGVLTGGLSVGLFKTSLFGTDPFQCFMAGISNVIPIDFGTLYMAVNAIMLVFILIFARKYIGFATLVNIFLLGYVVDFSETMLKNFFPEPDLTLRIIFLVVGTVILCFASAVYFTANLGVSTYDAIALMISSSNKKLPFKYCRIGTDLICVGIGFVFSAAIGVGTLLTAFFMGPLISLFRNKVTEPFLRKFKTT